MSVRPWAPGSYVLTQPYAWQSHTSYDLTGVTLIAPNGLGPIHDLIRFDGLVGVELYGGTLDGNLDGSATWGEFRFPLHIYGGSDIHVHHMNVIGISGDGIIINQQEQSKPLPENIRLDFCTFMGDNRNRCAIGIMCGTNIAVVSNELHGMGRPDMPGGIDIEPDYPWHRCQSIFVEENQIYGGPLVSQAAIRFTNSTAHAPISDVGFSRNTIEGGYQYGCDMWGAADVVETNMQILNNAISGMTVQNVHLDSIEALVAGNTGNAPPPAPAPEPAHHHKKRKRKHR